MRSVPQILHCCVASAAVWGRSVAVVISLCSMYYGGEHISFLCASLFAHTTVPVHIAPTAMRNSRRAGMFRRAGRQGEQGRRCVMLCRVVCLYIWLLEYCVSVSYEARSGCYDMAGWIWTCGSQSGPWHPCYIEQRGSSRFDMAMSGLHS